jgi:hypothetical protein
VRTKVEGNSLKSKLAKLPLKSGNFAIRNALLNDLIMVIIGRLSQFLINRKLLLLQ